MTEQYGENVSDQYDDEAVETEETPDVEPDVEPVETDLPGTRAAR